MQVNAGYLNTPRADYADLSRPLMVASAGSYRMLTVPCYRNRYRGRRDYQLLYVARGCAHFTVAGEERLLTAGHLVLYRPQEPQAYRYYAADEAQVYWLHFTGSDAAAVAGDTPAVVYVGVRSMYARLFERIVEELQMKRDGYEELTQLYLREMLIRARRGIEDGGEAAGDMRTEVRAAQAYFAEHYREAIDIGAYAAARHISTGWFIRHFRRDTGVTPLQYILRLRIASAQELWAHSDCRVAQVAQIVGYDNPLYFSRLFRQQTGMSPSEYRQKEKHSP